MSPNSPRLLIIDPDRSLRTLVSLALEAGVGAEVTEAELPELVLNSTSRQPFDCVIGDETALEKLPDAVSRKFILLTDSDASTVPAQHRSRVSNHLRRPVTAQKVWQVVQQTLSLSSIPQLESEGLYWRIRPDALTRFPGLSFDVFVRLSEDKYVRVYKKGDCFTEHDTDRFRQKGVEHLYLRREDCNRFLDQLAGEFARNVAENTVSFEIGYAVSVSMLEIIQEVCLRLGVTPETQRLARTAVDHTVKCIQQNPPLFKLFTRLMESQNRYIVDHSVTLAHVACGIASLQPWKSKNTFQQLTYAAFFHDITLSNPNLASILSYEEFIQRRSQFTPEEADSFLSHPEDSAAIIRKLTGLPPEVDEIVLEHHERPDGSGFPRQIDHQSVRPLVCVFIIAHEIVKFIFSGGKPEEMASYLYSFRGDWRKGHFRTVLDAMNLAFVRHEVNK